MKLIKQLILCGLTLPFLLAGWAVSGIVVAADDITSRALKLYEKHHYDEAIRLLRPEVGSNNAGPQAAASLALGMSYLGSAMLYRELHKTAQQIELDYLSQLSKQKAGTSSSYVNFYLGQAFLEAGKPEQAATHLRKFAGQVSAQSPFRNYASVELGLAYSKLKQQGKAEHEWAGLDTNVPELKAALAGAYAVAGKQEYKPVTMADAALADKKKSKSGPDEYMLRNLLRAYSKSGATEKALALLATSEFKNASFVEELGQSKTIRFYDMSLLGDIAHVHLGAALSYLEQASRDEKLNGTATYYLADAYLFQGNAEAAQRMVTSLLAQTRLPAHYRSIAQVYQASTFSLSGRQREAGEIWLSLAEKSGDDPALLAAVMRACAQVNGNCSKLEKLSLDSIEKGEGKKYFALNAALGRYYLLKKEYPKAVLYMEAGRDKANKNKIEVNDPVMLVALAEVYYRNKKFSENLEIYFELSKQYPAVRQVQEAMQGIYSMEHQSAGDVKIY